MSVLVIGRMTVDPTNVEKLWADRGADFEAVAKEAKAAGALSHRWALGDGFAVIIDEWSDAAAFQKFFDTQALIPELMQAAGVQGPPEFIIAEARQAPDEF
jgi:hypothetical protein